MKKSIIKSYYLLSIFAGIVIGIIFPIITLPFVESFKSNTHFFIFSVLCIVAGVFVSSFSLFLFKTTILINIKKITEGIQNKNIEMIKPIINSNDYLGEIGKTTIEFILQQDQLKKALLEKEIIELEIIEHELQYRQIFENNNLVKLIVDFETLEIIEANSAACYFYGYSYEEIKQLKFFDIDNNSFTEIRQYIDTFDWKAKKNHINRQHKLASGEIRDVEVFSGVVLINGKHSILYNIVDITEKMILQKENIKKTEELEKSNDIKDTLFSVIAHDLKGPIGSLNLLLTDVIENRNNYSSESIDEIIVEIKESNQRIYALLVNLLDWARIQKGAVLYSPHRSDIHELIVEGVSLLSGLLEEKGVLIDYRQNEDSFAFVDESMIKTVIRNIISNAIKYTNYNGKIEITVKNNYNYLEIEITDNGVGMSQNKITELFSNEVNISEYGTSGEKGTGIGISLCLDFIHKNRGTLLIESELGKGTKVIISLPKVEILPELN